MPRPTRTSRGEQPAGIRCARSVLRPANSAPGKDGGGEAHPADPPRSNLPCLAETYPAARTLEGWYPRKYAYCTIYRK